MTRFLIAACCATAAIVGLTLFVMARKDKEHARFFNTGKSVNAFLNDYKHALEDSFKRQNVSGTMAFYSGHYASPARGRWILKPDLTQGDVASFKLISDGGKDYAKDDVRDEITNYLKSLSAVDDIKFKIDLIEQAEPDRNVVLTVKSILDGKDERGSIFQDRNFYRWYLSDEGGGNEVDWKIIKDELVEGIRVAGDAGSFVAYESAQELARIGIDYKHERDPKLNKKSPAAPLKFAMMEHGFGGVSVTDYNNDGRDDIFFADGRRCRLYRNNGVSLSGAVSFTDVTREAGLDGIDQANAGIFADVDNDGFEDLFVVRYLAPCRFFHNNGDGTFTDRTREMGLDLVAPAMTACFLDYDRDGYADLYVGVYGNAFTDIPRLPFLAQNGGANHLFHNNGGHGFTDVTTASGTGDTGWTLAVAAADYDNDGYADIFVANDAGRKNLYHNNGNGTFTEVAKSAGVLDFGFGMGVAWGDFDDDGYFDLYTSNLNTNQRWYGEDVTIAQYLRNVVRTKWAVIDAGEYWKIYDLVGPRWHELGKMTGRGNGLFRNRHDGTFSDLEDSHTNRAGWSWGVAFFDYDNDTNLDIYAANGWISNKPDTDL